MIFIKVEVLGTFGPVLFLRFRGQVGWISEEGIHTDFRTERRPVTITLVGWENPFGYGDYISLFGNQSRKLEFTY